MAKSKLKVFGVRYIDHRYPRARAVVAATSRTRAGKLIGVSSHEMQHFASVTHNEAEVEWALAHPNEAWVFMEHKPVAKIADLMADLARRITAALDDPEELLREDATKERKEAKARATASKGKKTFLVRKRECRVYHFHVEADSEAEAKEMAEDLDVEDSESDQFDSWEFMDAAELKPE